MVKEASSIGASLPQTMFRIGVTGASQLDAAIRASLEPCVRQAIDSIRHHMIRAEGELAKYRSAGTSQAHLRVVSPLGEGADRLVAREALRLCDQESVADCTMTLEVVMPFEQDGYERTFSKDDALAHTASVAEFRELLSAAGERVLELDGAAEPDVDRARSYEAVGRFVVRNCDLLIAIWDDQKRPKGRGGTHDAIRYALHVGVPVLWFHAREVRPPRWLIDPLDLQAGTDRCESEDCIASFEAYLLRTLTLPPSIAGHSTLGLLVRRGQDPVAEYLRESGRQNWMLWRIHARFVGLLRKWGGRKLAGPGTIGGGAPRQRSSFAAGLSAIYQERYRTSYFLIFTAGAFALVAAIVGLARENLHLLAAWTELGMLALISGLLVANHLGRWHEKYISYRLLGELLRLHRQLDVLGSSVPGTRIGHVAEGAKRAWVAWFFAACARTSPMPTGKVEAERLARMKQAVAEGVLRGQIAFHSSRRAECANASALLAAIGFLLFLTTCAAVVFKLALLATYGHGAETTIQWLSVAAALLPGASAAIFGIRAYEEFERLAEQSQQMDDDLRMHEDRLSRIRGDGVGASQTLSAELFEIAKLLLSEVSGWAQLFRLKSVEA